MNERDRREVRIILMLTLLHQVGPVLVAVLAAASIVVGANLALRPHTRAEPGLAVTRLFAFGTGAFFTAVCLDFLPDAWASDGKRAALWIFLGAAILWAVTHLSDAWFERDQRISRTEPPDTGFPADCAADSAGSATDSPTDVSNPVVETGIPNGSLAPTLRFTRVSAIVLAGALSFHTFLEGIAISLAFRTLDWNTLGFALAMILHKLPEGVLWGFALAAVFPTDLPKIRRVLVIPAVCTVGGALLGVYLANRGSTSTTHVATGLVAGAMIYIAFAELLPALRDTALPRVTHRAFVTGLIVMFALNNLSGLFGGS